MYLNYDMIEFMICLCRFYQINKTVTLAFIFSKPDSKIRLSKPQHLLPIIKFLNKDHKFNENSFP